MGMHQLFEIETDAGKFEKVGLFGLDHDIDVALFRRFITCNRAEYTDTDDAELVGMVLFVRFQYFEYILSFHAMIITYLQDVFQFTWF